MTCTVIDNSLRLHREAVFTPFSEKQKITEGDEEGRGITRPRRGSPLSAGSLVADLLINEALTDKGPRHT
ncbi:unnamed protein product [Pieris macdunnoughi]|uniref:Uncharacterized protein n=1 Tax=Pieris macdunnoughi TaxID=345717 RepID=A0A821WBZ0_9NEOP|nr:unnamed protein product [Pieris macdunnoughi]